MVPTSVIKVRLLRPYRRFLAGFVLETSPGVADLLCNRRRPPFGEYVENDKPKWKKGK